MQDTLQYASQSDIYVTISSAGDAVPDEFSLPVSRAKWIHIGHTDDCEVVLRSLPQGFIAARALVLGSFFLLECGDFLELKYLSFVFAASDQTVTIRSSLQPEFFLMKTYPDMRQLKEVLDHPGSTTFYLALHDQRGRLVSAGGVAATLYAPGEDILDALQTAHLANFRATEADALFAFLNLKWWFLYWSEHGFGFVQPLLSISGVKEILVNGVGEVYVDLPSGLQKVPASFPSPEHLNRFVSSLCEQMNRRLDSASPIAQGMLAERYRVHILGREIVPDGPAVSIRCFPQDGVPISAFCATPDSSESQQLVNVLLSLVQLRKNILISGETSAGKSSLLEALSQWFAPTERVVVAEDVRELRLRNAHSVYLQTHGSAGQGCAHIGLRELVREALRMRPDRLVVGECRGAEALDLLQALNTGHLGSLATIHGSCPRSAVHRLITLAQFGQADVSRETLVSLVIEGISSVIQMRRGRDGRRYVESISQVLDCSQLGHEQRIEFKCLFQSSVVRVEDVGLHGTI
jgi:pilus assembly protein CpaF